MCPTLSLSCVSISDAAFAGDPAVRLDAVVQAVKHNNLTSVCNRDDAAPLDALANIIRSLTGV
jgi:hypothetical protein